MRFFGWLGLLALAGFFWAGPAWAQAVAELWPDSILDPGQANLILVVDKASQEMRIYQPDGQGNLILVKIIPCSTGMIKGDKLIRGDKKTPEGYYIFRQKLLPEELPDIYGILAYPMDYPNFWDQRSGRGGDGIWTHGVNKPLVDYDSNGCVELLNHDLAALEDSIRLYDTPILVVESLRLAPVEDQKKEAQAVRRFLESWRQAWVDKNHTIYRRHYSPQFVNSENRSFENWMDNKKRVASLYQKISVEMDDTRLFWHRDVIVASFIQRYQGDGRFQSVGLKRLYLTKSPTGYQILAEEFGPVPNPRVNKRLTEDQKLAALTTPPLAVASVTPPVVVASAGALAPLTPLAPLAPTLPPVPSTQSSLAANEESARVALEAGVTAGLEAESEPELEEGPRVVGAPGTVAEASTKATAADEGLTPSPPKIELLGPEALATAAAPDPGLPLTQAAAQIPPPDPASGPVVEGPPEISATQPTEEILQLLLAGWLAAWNARDEAGYFAFYDPEFYFAEKKLRLAEFKKYRGRLIRRAKTLEVKAENPRVRVQGERAWVVFTQIYQSDTVKDRGEKTLEFRSRQGQWWIVGEIWAPMP
ncbi:MAG: L,D-transpeptidase family protein [Deltaproteobacteria bacterium]|nr:L,D-transpeptidase family protein [Deltaproteobacteria bacterium]